MTGLLPACHFEQREKSFPRFSAIAGERKVINQFVPEFGLCGVTVLRAIRLCGHELWPKLPGGLCAWRRAAAIYLSGLRR
jgi:hypothetical protein